MDLETVLIRGATYSGSWFHSILNYALIAVTMLPYHSAGRSRRPLGLTWLWPLLVATVLQVAFWFTLGVEGVSIVWCTMAGFTGSVLVTGGQALSPAVRSAALLSLVSGGAAVAFYSVTTPIITTVAHVAALVLGIVVWAVARLAFGRTPSST